MNAGYSSDYLFLLVIAYSFLTRPIAVLFHELGHAIPGLIYSKGKVRVFVGTMGNPKGMWKVNLGRLEINFKYAAYHRSGGVCYFDDEKISVNKRIVRIAGGPFMSLLCVLICCLLLKWIPFNGLAGTAIIGFATTSFLIFYGSAQISNRRVRLDNGRHTFNDLTIIRNILSEKKYKENYRKAAECYNSKNYKEASVRFKELIDHNLINPTNYRLTINSFMNIKDFETAKEMALEFENYYPKEAAHYSFSAHIYVRLNDFEKGLIAFQKSAAIDPGNVNLISNCGYSFLQLKRYDKAIAEFEKVIILDPNFSYAHANLGLAKFLNGKTEEGISIIEHSLQMDDKNAYGFLNMGKVKLLQNEKEEALKFFLRAKEIDANTHLVDEYIAKAKE
jgi:tetratricopeptide (TPR) repeat protein